MEAAVEWLGHEINKIYTEFPDQLFYDVALLLQKAKEMEAKQRQEDTNNGYAQGYDDAAQGKEPMRPEIRNAEKQSYQDKMRDKVNKAKSRLK
jgi:hypothetical protein